MKMTLKLGALALFTAISFASCRDTEEKEETAEDQAQEMIDNADEVKIKEDKVKIENADGSETKIKYDENGNVEKIKTDD